MFLELEQVTMRFGGLTAVNNVSMQVKQHEIHGLIGPNGSGKTTILNVISGFYKPSEGTISFEGTKISGKPAHQITAAGLARTFQNLKLFSSMTVLDNVLVGMGLHAKTGLLATLVNPMAVQREDSGFIARAMQLLDLLDLADHAHDRAISLPYGYQRRVEIARALATRPKILLLDEPAAGLNEIETDKLQETLLKIRDSGVTIFLVEHDMKLVMAICEIITVLDYGTKISEGTGADIRNDAAVVEAYLGQEENQ